MEYVSEYVLPHELSITNTMNVDDGVNRVGSYKLRGETVYVRLSSVTSSFRKLFKYKDERCILIPSHEFINSSALLNDIEALRLCKEWLDYLCVPEFEFISKYYRRKNCGIKQISSSNLMKKY